MEQKEVVHRYHLSMDGLTAMKDRQFPLHGETNLYKLMSRSDPLTSAFLHEKVNLNKLKEALEEQGLPFSFNETKEGTHLFFRVKDNELAKNALETVIKNIQKDPKRLLKKPNSMTFDEKVAYVKQAKKYQGSIEKTATMSKGRGK